MDRPSFIKDGAEVLHNQKTKLYLDGFEKYTFASRPIFKDPRFEEIKDPAPFRSKPQDKMEQRDDNCKRAIERLFDIAYLNRFDYMITLTVDQKKLDRYDPRAVSDKVKTWLRNQVYRHDLRYLIVPELHEDGAVHMHGLISGDLEYPDSGTVLVPGYDKPMRRELAIAKGFDMDADTTHTVYNIPAWKYGWSTAVACYGDVANAARYMCKYVTKDLKKIFGNYYYAGGGIVRNPEIELGDTRFTDMPGNIHYIPEGKISFKYGTLKEGIYYDE